MGCLFSLLGGLPFKKDPQSDHDDVQVVKLAWLVSCMMPFVRGQVHWEYVIFERQQIYPEFVVRSVDTAPGMHPIYQVEFELFWLLMSVNARPPFHK